MNFTGIKDTDLLILQQLDDPSLMNVCVVNKYVASLCDNENFWMNRIIKVQSKDALQLKKINQTYKELYFHITYPLVKCFNVKRNAKSNLVIEDLYGKDGYIRNISDPKSLDDFKDYIFLKIVLQFMDKKEQNGEKINKTSRTKFRNRIAKISKGLPQKYHSAETYILTDNDIATFYAYVLNSKEPVTEKSISDYSKINIDREYELFDMDYSFIYQIHRGFKNLKLPLTITWTELCTHPYFSRKIKPEQLSSILKRKTLN